MQVVSCSYINHIKGRGEIRIIVTLVWTTSIKLATRNSQVVSLAFWSITQQHQLFIAKGPKHNSSN